MGKNIILLSDGTGNGAAKRNKTNVWRLYDALDLQGRKQVACYDDGVGSQEFLPLKLLGGVFGWGLKRNVQELYMFLCHNYEPGDRIYLFGFSRGAYTVRLLAGMIAFCGVYADCSDEEQLKRVTKEHYNAFRSQFTEGMLTQWVRKYTGKTESAPMKYYPDITFMGVWDTVDAYGLPFDGLARFWDRYIYPIYFPDRKLSSRVKKACHALSVDDERKTFHPLLWDESEETDPSRIEQVWFPGVHSDVGGGYPRSSLALVSLDWMLARVAAQAEKEDIPGLYFIQQCREEIRAHANWHGPQHDSRALAGVYYRYSPRDIERLCSDKKAGVQVRCPQLHRSVLERVARNAVPYVPHGLPQEYEVVVTNDAKERPPDYEAPQERVRRKAETRAVATVIRYRKVLYFCMLATTLVFVASPVYCRLVGCQKGTSPDGAVSSLFDWIRQGVPKMLTPWIDVLRDHPMFFWALVVLYLCFFLVKGKLWQATQRLAARAWAELKTKKLVAEGEEA